MSRTEYALAVLRALASLWQSVIGTIVTMVFLIAGVLAHTRSVSAILLTGTVVVGAITMHALTRDLRR